MSLKTLTSRDPANRSSHRLYGWPGPVNLSIYGALAAFVVGSALALEIATVALSVAWGPPGASPLLDVRISRPALLGMALLVAPLTLRVRQRGAALAALAVLMALCAAPLYNPLQFVSALVRVIRARDASHAVALGASLVLGAGLVGLLAHATLGLFRFRATAVRGSTKWGKAQALRSARTGLLLGRLGGAMLRYDGDGHLLTVAATRSGKGVGTILPNLLHYRGSLVVTDPKGENYFVTARYRRDRLGHEAVALDPFGLTDEAHAPWSFNPLELIDLKGEDFVETAMMMADMMASRSGKMADLHWNIEAKALLYTLILHASGRKDPGRRNLIEVRRLLTQAPKELGASIKEMQDSPLEQVQEGAGRILQKADRERSAVFSTAQSYTHFLSSPRMRRTLMESNFKLDRLLAGDLSLYLILPREHLGAFAPWLRLMISCCYYTCTHNLLQRRRSKRRVLFLLDEFANLGYMANMKEAVSLGGGYGLTLWLILQDLAQLRREYRDEWESFVANSDVIQTFAIQDPFTIDKVARMLGETTIWQRRMRKGSRIEGGRFIRDYDEQSRALLRPDELRRLHPGRQLILVRPYQPVVADKIVYYKDPFFQGRFDPNPYVTGDPSCADRSETPTPLSAPRL